jgi:hypothetical protein
MDTERIIMDDTELRQSIWFGHTKQMNTDSWPKTALDWIPPGRQKQGRLRCRWTQGIEQTTTARNLQDDEWQDRNTWRMEVKKQRQP